MSRNPMERLSKREESNRAMRSSRRKTWNQEREKAKKKRLSEKKGKWRKRMEKGKGNIPKARRWLKRKISL